MQRADLEAGRKPDKVMGAQAHKRTVTALQRQIAAQEKRVEEVSWGLVGTSYLPLSFPHIATKTNLV